MKFNKIPEFARELVFAVILLMVVICGTTRLSSSQEEDKKEQAKETIQTVQDEPGQLYARSAVLMDADSGRVLFGKEEEEIRPMASTTKIMTCILTLENMTKGQVGTVSKRAAGQPKVRLGVKEGEKYEMKDLLYSLMLESHNDSAVVIAETIGGSVEGFAQMMNEKAESLGCKDTHFITPNGLDETDEGGVHSTTAKDLARIMKYCIMESPKKEEFLEITRTKNYTVRDLEGKRSTSCNNHNAFLTMMDGALSGKTGFTGDAGYCYVGALRRDDRTFIVALLGCGWPNNKGYKWKDTRKLMEYGLLHYQYQNVWDGVHKSLKSAEEIPINGGVDQNNHYIHRTKARVGIKEDQKKKAQEFRMLLKENERVTTEKNLVNSLEAPVKKGDPAGNLIYKLNGEEIGRYDMVVLEDVKKRDVFWCFREIAKRVFL